MTAIRFYEALQVIQVILAVFWIGLGLAFMLPFLADFRDFLTRFFR